MVVIDVFENVSLVGQKVFSRKQEFHVYVIQFFEKLKIVGLSDLIWRICRLGWQGFDGLTSLSLISSATFVQDNCW